ncbi:ribosomal protein S18-alanine N-acetyltransferase [Myxococcota bacterium]|nr:ribosomal protein S18-alanine N-acetyltransferase [Myxococcota bacterium]
MSTNVEIGLARPSDADVIAKMSRELVEDGLPWTWLPRRVARAIRDPDVEVIVARDEGRIVGFAVMKLLDDEAHLLLFGVEGRYQRRGVGRRLIEWLEALGRAAGLASIYLEVRATNQRARSFYRSLGYSQQALLRRYYSGVEDAVVMVNHLVVAMPR